ncbi:nucleotide-binding universal stress UspA family protein [Nocardia transvalensis]|uniref:Nucleotide-binding universal stress UspA family protein n=1 Tax=Nocardia transvalensis TaxID=37333 RepID=A0A7W9PJN8_9NOCA|nr:universal stress protein [Nocardia transvalensis]MBB5916718.1 nucleotide-binding universal stress UspA family protein [Nocardia transvalensis]
MTGDSAAGRAVSAPVLVAVDDSEVALRAVAWAAAEAALHRCPLHILTSFGVAPRPGLNTVLAENERAWLRGDGMRLLARAVAAARRAVPDTDVAVTTELTFDLITPTLIDRSAQVRMIVVGNHGRGAIGRAVLGSVSTAVSRHARCPVAVVHLSPPDPVSAEGPVLVGVDGTLDSAPALAVAFDEASRRKVGLVALHAWSGGSESDAPVVSWDDVRSAESAALTETVAGWRERYPDVDVEPVVVCDSPVRSLLERSARAQLLVVGSRGRGGFAGMVLGSTSTALLHVAECTVIVARGQERTR